MFQLQRTNIVLICLEYLPLDHPCGSCRSAHGILGRKPSQSEHCTPAPCHSRSWGAEEPIRAHETPVWDFGCKCKELRKWDKGLELLSVILKERRPRMEPAQRKTQLSGERGTLMTSFEPLASAVTAACPCTFQRSQPGKSPPEASVITLLSVAFRCP